MSPLAFRLMIKTHLLSTGYKHFKHAYRVPNSLWKLIRAASCISETGNFLASGPTLSDFSSSNQYVPRASDRKFYLARPKKTQIFLLQDELEVLKWQNGRAKSTDKSTRRAFHSQGSIPFVYTRFQFFFVQTYSQNQKLNSRVHEKVCFLVRRNST